MALIFAGGTGKRMSSRSKPKQFLEMHGKPIIIYTLEHFEFHEDIDNIVIVCLEEWIKELEGLLKRFGITKVVKIVPGGSTGHDSIYNGLAAMKETTGPRDIVLIHDGVRPLINKEILSQNIEAVKKYGSAITAELARESVVRSMDGHSIAEVPPREQMYIAKAIDSSHLCSIYQYPMHIIPSTKNNLKITEPADFYIYRALYEALEGQQIFGI